MTKKEAFKNVADALVLFKDFNGCYFLANEKVYEALSNHKITILKLNTKDKNEAMELLNQNFNGYKLIIKE